MDLTSGYKKTAIGILPETWKVEPLASVTPKGRPNGIVDGPFGSNLKTIHYKSSGIPIITSGYVTEGRFRADAYFYVDSAKFREEKRSAVRPGDIVMAKIGARCGASAILPEWHEIGILSGNALKISVDESRHNTSYVWQVLWELYSSGRMEALRAVGAQPAISMASLKKHLIPLPPLPEQRAIAAALDTVDVLLGGLDRLIAKKRDLKQAAMQQLLTGQTRLPGFAGNWNSGHLSDVIGTLEAGVSVNSVEDESATDHNGWYILKTSAVTGGRFIPQECKKIAPRDIARARLNPKKNTILISRMNTPDLVGECGYVDRDFTNLFVPDRLWMTHFRQDTNTSGMWLSYVLSTPSFRRQIGAAATGTSGSMKNLSKQTFLQMPIALPSEREQSAIATVLADMDAEITGLEQRRDKTRLLKQGMMQELLTGRTRLS